MSNLTSLTRCSLQNCTRRRLFPFISLECFSIFTSIYLLKSKFFDVIYRFLNLLAGCWPHHKNQIPLQKVTPTSAHPLNSLVMMYLETSLAAINKSSTCRLLPIPRSTIEHSNLDAGNFCCSYGITFTEGDLNRGPVYQQCAKWSSYCCRKHIPSEPSSSLLEQIEWNLREWKVRIQGPNVLVCPIES